VYGLDDGALVCLDPANGELKWKGKRYGHGQMILTGSLLRLGAENGEVILLQPDPREPRELGRFTALKTKTWNPPALAGEYLLVRNDLEAACFRLPVQN
jgi:outer membrane protein assembly factor BamB